MTREKFYYTMCVVRPLNLTKQSHFTLSNSYRTCNVVILEGEPISSLNCKVMFFRSFVVTSACHDHKIDKSTHLLINSEFDKIGLYCSDFALFVRLPLVMPHEEARSDGIRPS